ncbi:hypothetical protein [Psychrobacter sp.]
MTKKMHSYGTEFKAEAVKKISDNSYQSKLSDLYHYPHVSHIGL